jgi:hypothetical protein
MNENIPHLRLVPPANRPAPGTRPRFTRGDLTDTFQKQNPRVYTILDKMADRAATWCADKVREDFKDSSSLANTETPIAAAMGLAPHTIRICFLGELPLPSFTRFPDVRLVAKGCGFQDPDIPVVLCAPSNDRQTQSQTIIYIDKTLLNKKNMAACLARAAAYNDMGPKDFILRTLLEMIQNKGQHMGTPLQQELDQLGTTTLKTMAFISPSHR